MSKQHAPRFVALCEAASERVPHATKEEVKGRLDAGEAVPLVDVREESEFAAGRLPGATHLSKGVIERDVEKTFPDPTAELILYCGGGYRSALAADNLRQMGYTNAVSLDGGWRAWTTAGLPTES
jgi:rhodanese-related sulfurtransferase